MNKFTRSLVVLAFSMMGLSGYADTWDGVSSDVSWYSESDTEFHIKRAAQLKGLSDLVKEGHSFEGKTVYLDDDIDLGYSSWRPIGGNYYNSIAFNGTFDAQNHKVTYVHPEVNDSPYWSMHCYGLFGSAGAKSIIRNLTVSGGVELYSQGGDVVVYAGGIAGSSGGKIENVHSNFNISASDKSNRDIPTLYAGGVCGDGNEITLAQSSGSIGFAFANVYWRVYQQGGIGGIAGKASNVSMACSDVDISMWTIKQFHVGGLVGEVTDGEINNSCFYGKLKVLKDIYYATDARMCACGGIIGGTYVKKNFVINACISAPKEFQTDYDGWMISPMAGDYKYNNYEGNNNYYTIPTGYSNVLGNQIDESTLMRATSLPGFDSNIWDFSNGKPMLKALKVKYCVSVRLDKGLIGYVVNDGGDLSLKLMTDAGYAVSKVYFNDTDVTDCLQGQDLNLTNITSNGELKFIFTQDDSAVKMIENNDKPNFSISGKNLVFDDVTSETPLRVYNVEGRLVCSMKVNSNQSVPLNSGIYIVKLGKYTYKVSI